MRFKEFTLSLLESFQVEPATATKSPQVADIQKALVALGYPLPKHGVDGIRGPETIAAIKQFQQANNIRVDGVPGKETADAINAVLKLHPLVAGKLVKSTTADVKGAPAKSAAKTDTVPITGSADIAQAKTSAEAFLGRQIDDNEWNYLLRATVSESSPNTTEQAYVMGVILNRTRSGKWGNSIVDVLTARNQFQAVTGTRYDPGPSANFTRGPNSSQLASIAKGAVEILPKVPKSLMNFTAASKQAYGKGTDISFRDKLLAKGGTVIGGTIFA